MNLSRIDLVSMHLLLQCASRGSISSAAAHCHLSVMGASERLRRLDDYIAEDNLVRAVRTIAAMKMVGG